MATTIARVSTDLASRCEFCNEHIDGSRDFAKGVSHYLQAHGCELRHVGQETIEGGDGKPWQTTVAILSLTQA
jgi:hypothetical protein